MVMETMKLEICDYMLIWGTKYCAYICQIKEFQRQHNGTISLKVKRWLL